MRRFVPLGLLLALAAVPAPADAQRARAATLERFDDCADLTRFARRQFVRTDGTTGVPLRAGIQVPAALRPPGFAPQAARQGEVMPSVAAAAPEAGTDFSTTNVQEAGVDEADLVKTNGRHLFVASGGALRVLDVTGAAPRVVGRLALDGSAHQLLLRGSRLLVLASSTPPFPVIDGSGGGPRPAISVAPPTPWSQKVLLAEIDVADPAAPKVVRTMDLAGQLAGARLTGGTARVVVASTPEPAPSPEVAAAAPTSRFVPRTTLRSRVSKRTFRRSVVPCERVRHPRAFSGLDLLSVLTVDLDRGLFSVKRDAVMASAQDVYASPRSLVVASRRYAPQAPGGFVPSGGATELHVFDAGGEPSTAYRGSGSVPGFVLNQFAISEHEGALRVATTEDAPFGPQGPAGESESGVSVLRLTDGRLRTVGRVTGLGRGERIYAVRFLGDRGYVVTFRQVDPLYALDLRDAEAPRVTGELKISGYSAYLHPVSDTLLLGVGQDASEEGRRLGPQASLFDVGDPARPALLHRASLGGSGMAGAEQDHHAFLWWPRASLAVLPVESYETRPDGTWTAFAGAVGLRVGRDGLREVARVEHPKPGEDRTPPPIGRSVVVGDRLLTLSASGVATNRLADLAPLAFTPLD